MFGASKDDDFFFTVASYKVMKLLLFVVERCSCLLGKLSFTERMDMFPVGELIFIIVGVL